jgi:hypothetical protein
MEDGDRDLGQVLAPFASFAQWQEAYDASRSHQRNAPPRGWPPLRVWEHRLDKAMEQVRPDEGTERLRPDAPLTRLEEAVRVAVVRHERRYAAPRRSPASSPSLRSNSRPAIRLLMHSTGRAVTRRRSRLPRAAPNCGTPTRRRTANSSCR